MPQLRIRPKGAKELDTTLVSEPLDWLKDYPKTRKTFCIALKQYTDGVYIRDVADNFRKALEEFFQEFLGNTKNLANDIAEIFKIVTSILRHDSFLLPGSFFLGGILNSLFGIILM